MKESTTLLRRCLAEAVGTFFLAFFGVGSVHAAVQTGAQQGIWQVAIVWGAAISLAIYATGAVSGAHMNPAMTVSFAVFRGFPWRHMLPYVFSPVLGAIGGAALYQYVVGRTREIDGSSPEIVSESQVEEFDGDLVQR